MPTLTKVVDFIEEIAPRSLAAEWDNPGLLVRAGEDASRILVALDITPPVVEEAQQKGCGLIVSHHPVIFHPLHRLERGNVVYRLAQAGISALCAHTNLDMAQGGVNDVLAALLGLTDVETVEPFGRVGNLKEEIPAATFASFCGSRLGNGVQLADAGVPVRRVVVVGGSGGDVIPQAVAEGAQCVVTGEAGHHNGLDAVESGVSLIVAGHYATEAPVVPVLAERLRQRFADAEVLVSEKQFDPFRYITQA